jgi:hypothetical protein
MSKRAKPKKSTQITPNDKKVIHWMEVGVAAMLLLILITLHIIALFHFGGLWRDEVNSVNVVTMSSVFDFGEKYQTDSFPILWFLLLRAWIFIGFGGTDLALRLLGLLTGLGVLGALWYVGRILGSRLPVIALVLFAMSPVVFVGDSLRAYGLGVLLILLALAAMWSVLKNPTPRRMVVCAAVVILSVQCLYNNSFLIFAICMGAAAVGLYRRQWKLMVFPLGVGILAAVSVAPYLVIFSKVSDWHILISIPVDLMWFFHKFQKAIDPSGILLTWVWAMLALLTVILFIWLLVKPAQAFSVEEKELALFLLTTMLISIIVYFVFVKILSWKTESWYYLPLLAILVVIIDRGVEMVCKISSPGRIVRIVCVLGIAFVLFMDSWNTAHTRKTNVDVLAAKLETLAGKDDLVVVTRFFYGVSFARYYKGSAPWVTLPDIADHSVHRYDLVKDKMMEKEPIKPVLQKMTKTLQSGHRVWLVGRLNFLHHGEIPQELPPAPNSPYRWSQIAYEFSWSDMAAYTLQTYGRTLKVISIPVDGPVYEEENLPLMVVQDRLI